MTLGLGLKSYARTGLPEVVLRNLYVEKDESGISPDGTLRVPRPGLVLQHTYDATIRGLHYRTSTSEQLVVSGAYLYSGTRLIDGAMAGTEMVAMVSTPFATLIAAGGILYRYDTLLGAMTLPNDAPSDGYVQDVDQLNGYGLVLLPNGRFYWLVPGDTTIDPLNYATAESLPDGGVALRRLGDEFWIFGTENIEVWQATGDLDAPFQRATGRNFERGCLYRDAVRRFDNTLVWIGDDCQVYRASAVPQVISDPGISDRIRKATGPCSAWTFGIDGHSFYVLRIPGQGTFAYDPSAQTWAEFRTSGQSVWAPWAGYQEAGKIYAGSSLDGSLYIASADALDDAGLAIECTVTGTIAIRGKPPRNDSFSIGAFSNIDTTIRFRWKDGQDDFPAYYDEVEIRAPFDVATVYRLGQPDQPYRTWEISHSGPGRVVLAGAIANEAWR